MKTLGPLEIVRSPPWETWRARWNRPRADNSEAWMYRWALVTPRITLRWLSSEFRAMCRRDAPTKETTTAEPAKENDR